MNRVKRILEKRAHLFEEALNENIQSTAFDSKFIFKLKLNLDKTFFDMFIVKP